MPVERTMERDYITQLEDFREQQGTQENTH